MSGEIPPEERVRAERVRAGARRGATGGIEVIDPDPDGWAADWIAVLDARRARKRNAGR